MTLCYISSIMRYFCHLYKKKAHWSMKRDERNQSVIGIIGKVIDVFWSLKRSRNEGIWRMLLDGVNMGLTNRPWQDSSALVINPRTNALDDDQMDVSCQDNQDALKPFQKWTTSMLTITQNPLQHFCFTYVHNRRNCMWPQFPGGWYWVKRKNRVYFATSLQKMWLYIIGGISYMVRCRQQYVGLKSIV